MDVALILFISGVGLLAFLWFRVQGNPLTSDAEASTSPPAPTDAATRQLLGNVPALASGDAVLVSREHGQLVFINEPARQLLGMNGGDPHLEQVLRLAKPADHFLELLSREAQTSFQLGKRWVEASSHRIPSGAEMRTVIILRELTSTTRNPDQLDLSQAIRIINQIGEMVSASSGIETTLLSLLTIIRQELLFDAGEINLHDPETGHYFPRGWVGDATYLVALAEFGGYYARGEGVTGWIAEHQSPILLPTRADIAAFNPKVPSLSYQSVVGVPLWIGQEMLGTLELASNADGFFNLSHVALLQAISKPVALAIHNASLYDDQIRRLKEITSLQQQVEREASEQISASAEPGDAETIVYSVLNRRVAELVNAEMCGVFIHDDARRSLLPAVPFHGLPSALVRSLTIPLPPGSPQADIWHNQPYWISNDLSDEPLSAALGLDSVIGVAGIRNTAWLPLMIGQERIGILAVSNKRHGDFVTPDIPNLQAIASQAAIVVENLRLAARERRLDAELAGLQEMTSAIGSMTREQDLLAEITERIAKLMKIEMCGILTYDAASRTLVSRLPFYGVADEQVESYRILIEPGSVIEELWQEESAWYSNRVETDALVFAAGLDELARSIGVQKTLMAKLTTGGRDLGVVQVSNRLDGGDFDESSVRLLAIYAAQASTMIENARLFSEVQRTSEQAQKMRRIAEVAGAIVESRTGLPPLLEMISQYLDSPKVFINIVDEANNLVTYPHWVVGDTLHEPIYQDLNAPGARFTVVLSRHPFYSNDLQGDRRVLGLYRRAIEQFNLRNVALVPLVAGERSLGELGIADRDGVYTQADIDILTAIAAQITSTLERLILYEITGQNLSRREQELDAVSRVSNELTQTVDFTAIMNVIRKEALNATGASGSTVALLRPFEEWQSPNEPEMETRLGNLINMPRLADIERAAIMSGATTVLVNNYDQSDYAPLPGEAKSALAAGILFADYMVGVIHLYHVEPNRFDERAAAFLLTLASKASLGYANALRFREQEENNRRLRLRVEQLNRIFDLGHMLPSNTAPNDLLEAVAYSIQQAVGFDSILMLLVDERAGVLRRVTNAGMPVGQFRESQDRTISVETLKSMMTDQYRMEYSETYFFPIEDVENWYRPGVEALSVAFDGNRTINLRGRNSWHDGDMLIVCMYGTAGRLLGAMSLDRPFSDQRPDRATVEVLEIFAHQAATTLENSRLYLSSVRNAQQEALFNDMLEAMSGSLEIETIAEAVAHGVYTLQPYDRLDALIVNARRNGYEMYSVVAGADGELHRSKERIADLPAGALALAFHQQSDALYSGDDLLTHDDLRHWHADGERTAFIIPLAAAGISYGALHIGLKLTDPDELAEAQATYKRVAQLFSGAVQNARLFDRALELQALNESVVESIQQGIVVLDRSGRILNMNRFMMRYGWGDNAIDRDIYSYDPEMAGTLADQLRDVLEHGLPSSVLDQPSVASDGTPQLRSFYLYPLRSDDVVRGAVILVEDVTQRAERTRQLERLTRASSVITGSLERADVVESAMHQLRELIPYETMTLWRRNGSYMVLEGSGGGDAIAPAVEDLRIRIDDYSAVRALVDTQETVLLIYPADTDPDAAPHLPGSESAAAWLGVPLVNQGHVVGMITLASNRPDVYDNRDDRNIALTFASQVAIALANAELFQQTFDRTSELELLLEVAQMTSLSSNMDEVFDIIVNMMFAALQMDRCAVLIWDEVDDALEVRVDRNNNDDPTRALPRGTRLDLSRYPARRQALRERDVVVAFRTDPERNFPEEIAELERDGVGARILVPLVVREEAIGLIQLEQNIVDSQGMSQQTIRLARALSSQVAIAIENGRLTEEMASMIAESLVINDLTKALSSTFSINEMIDIVRRQVPAVTGAEQMYLALYEPETDEITFPFAVSRGKEITIPPRQLNDDEVSFIIRRNRMLTIGADYFTPEDLRKSLGIRNGEGNYKSYLGVPLAADDKVFGVLALVDTQRTSAFTMNEQRILTTVGAQLGAVVQNARLFQRVQSFADELEDLVEQRTLELEEERDRIDTLYQITSELSRSLDMERVQQRALGMMVKAIGADDGAIMTLDPLTDELITQAALIPSSIIYTEDGRPTHPSEMIGNWLIANGESDVMIHDLRTWEGWDSHAPGAEGWLSAMGVVLENNDNDPQGVMVLLSRQLNAFSEAEQRLLVAAGNQVAAATNNADLYNLIRDQADRLGYLLRTEQEEAEKSKAILASITDGVVLSDAEGKIVLFNAAAERILDLPRDEVLGQPLSRFTGLYDADVNAWAQRIQDQTERPEDAFDMYMDDRLELNDRIVSVQISPVYTENRFLGMVHVYRDITRDVEVDRLKTEFVSNVSHELRTPLTPIKGFTELLLMGVGGEITEMQRSTLNMIRDNVDRLATLVEDILDISKIDSGRDRLNVQLVHLDQLLKAALENRQARYQHKNRNLKVSLEVAPDVPEIEADPGKLSRIMSNIIDNAFNYTPDGGSVRVKAVHLPDQRRVLITVTDSGVGIAEEFRDNIWKRFQRYEEHALRLDVAGTGLGLSIVKEMVEMHRGDVWFESEIDKGTTFFVSLPVEQAVSARGTQTLRPVIED